MKLAAAVVVVAALVLPAAQAAEQKTVTPPVLGFDQTKTGVYRLAWFDPTTLTTLRGRKARIGRYTGSWSFSPDRSVLAVAAGQTSGTLGPLLKLRFVNARGMRVLGELSLGVRDFDTVTWLRPDRLLAVVRADASVAVVDPSRRALVQSVPLVRPPANVARLSDGLALLLGSQDSFAPAVVAVVDAAGALRTVTLDRISIGSVVNDQGRIDVRTPGFAVDTARNRAFVVGTDFTVAEVDLDTLHVVYHGGSTRSLAKYVYGPVRDAVWLGKGLLAVSGTNYSGDETKGEPVGLRLIDTRDWSTRLVDPSVGNVWRVAGSAIFFASGAGPSTHYDAYNMDGTLRYQLDLADGEWLSVEGPFGYVCGGKDRVLRMLDVANGAQAGMAGARPACPTLLYAHDD
jgi:hypothetical protein